MVPPPVASILARIARRCVREMPFSEICLPGAGVYEEGERESMESWARGRPIGRGGSGPIGRAVFIRFTRYLLCLKCSAANASSSRYDEAALILDSPLSFKQNRTRERCTGCRAMRFNEGAYGIWLRLGGARSYPMTHPKECMGGLDAGLIES